MPYNVGIYTGIQNIWVNMSRLGNDIICIMVDWFLLTSIDVAFIDGIRCFDGFRKVKDDLLRGKSELLLVMAFE
jgi:hypothetical protein